MSLLRIHCSLRDTPQRCQWALVGDGREAVVGDGPLEQLPQRAERVQLVLPAAEVLITRARLPQSARRRAGSVLAYAVEDETVGDPDANQVSWLGSVGDADVLAVADRHGLAAWHDALETAGIRGYEVHCETLMLPWMAGEWSLAWNGREGFVRSSEFEGTATDCGDPASPPLSLRLMLDDAKTRGEAPASIAVYATAPDAPLEIEAWQRALGVALRLAEPWYWRTAPPDAGISLAFLSGNSISGIVTLSPSSDGRPDRIMRRAGGFRNEPSLMGSTSYGVGFAHWTCDKPEHWVFDGTNMKKGDRVVDLVGWEYHGPPLGDYASMEVLSSGQVYGWNGEARGRGYATTIYTAPKGNLVFNAGTCWWNMVLSSPPVFMSPPRRYFKEDDARIQRMTKNVLNKMIAVAPVER